MEELAPRAFFDLSRLDHPVLKGLFATVEPVWKVLDAFKEILRRHIRPNVPDIIEPYVPITAPIVILPGGWLDEGFEIVQNQKGKIEIIVEGEPRPEASLIQAGVTFTDRHVEIGRGVVIESSAYINGPTVIMDGTEVRQGAYVRGDCFFGRSCVVGHTTEVKHSIFLDGAKAGHFAYIGDSILGNGVNLGAGTKLANLRLDGRNIVLNIDGKRFDTGRRKIGAILGDGVQTGCNSVTNPGTLLGQGSLVAPNSSVRPGLYSKKTVIK